MISVGNKILIPKKETFEGLIRFWPGIPTSGVSLRTDYARMFAQKFEIPTSGSYLLDRVVCYRSKYNITSGGLYCAIYSDNNGVPDSELHRVYVSHTSIGTANSSYGGFYFSDVYLNGKTPYWIVFYPSTLYNDRYFTIMHGRDATGNTFPTAQYSSTGGWIVGSVGAWQNWLAGTIIFAI